MPHLIRNGQPVSSCLADKKLSSDSTIMVSAAALNKPDLNREMCAPGSFHAMPSIAYRLARVAAGDGVCGVSLYAVSAHDVVAGHPLLRGLSMARPTLLRLVFVRAKCFALLPASFVLNPPPRASAF